MLSTWTTVSIKHLDDCLHDFEGDLIWGGQALGLGGLGGLGGADMKTGWNKLEQIGSVENDHKTG